MTACHSAEFTPFRVHRQPITVAFDGPEVVSDAGLLTVRSLDQHLGYLADLAHRLPDPRAQQFVTHTKEAILTQQVYQLLADYPDCNDADALRSDPLFQTLAGVCPDEGRDLACGSTLARFQYAFTRRQRELPPEDRPAFREMDSARSRRPSLINDFLIATFIRTRRRPPAYVILDVDPTDEPTHGRQALAAYHGYYGQHQYFPLLIFDGASGFPLGAWLRPGTAAGAVGAVDALRQLVAALRGAWPDVVILVRGDSSLAGPDVYDFCEAEGLLYAFGYASNPVLQRRTAHALAELELYYHFYGQRVEPQVQRFEVLEDYQAESWSRPRRLLCKLECTPQGAQRRFVVSNLPGDAGGIYRGFYVQRGAVPEQPIGELKNGLDLGRLSASSFRANAYRLLLHVVAYGLVVLLREAAAAIAEVSRASVSTLRSRLWKVGASVQVQAGRIVFRVAASWPRRALWLQVQQAVTSFVTALSGRGVAGADGSPEVVR
jgi:hypothetical protein